MSKLFLSGSLCMLTSGHFHYHIHDLRGETERTVYDLYNLVEKCSSPFLELMSIDEHAKNSPNPVF